MKDTDPMAPGGGLQHHASAYVTTPGQRAAAAKVITSRFPDDTVLLQMLGLTETEDDEAQSA